MESKTGREEGLGTGLLCTTRKIWFCITCDEWKSLSTTICCT